MPVSPMFQGGSPQISGAPMPELHAHEVGAFAGRQLEAANANRAAFAGQVANAFANLQDYKTETEGNQALADLRSSAEVEAAQALNAAPGSEASWFFEDGSLDTEKLKAFADSYYEQANGVAPSFINPERAVRFDAAKSKFKEAAIMRLVGRAELAQLSAIRRVSEGALDRARMEAVSTGEMLGVDSELERQVEAGVLTRDEAEVARGRIAHDVAWQEGNNLVVEAPDVLQLKLDHNLYDGVLSPLEQHGLRGKLRARAEEGRYDFLKSFLITKPGGADRSGKKDDTPEFTGYYTEQECRWIHAIGNKQFEDVRREIVAAATEEAAAFNPQDPYTKGWEIWRDDFLKKYEAFGLEKNFINRLLHNAEERNRNLTSPTIPISQALDRLELDGGLVNQSALQKRLAEWTKENGKGSKYDWEKYGVLRKKYAALAGIEEGDNDIVATRKFERYVRNNHTKVLRGDIVDRWTVWRQLDEEGKTASPVVQLAKLQEIARTCTGNRALGLSYDVTPFEKASEDLKRIQIDRYSDWANKSGQRVFVNTQPVRPAAQRVLLGFDREQTQLPPGVLLPEKMMEGVDAGKAVVEVTFDNKHYRRFRIVGTCEGDAPQMTAAVARQGFYDPRNSYEVEMTIQKGEADELMGGTQQPEAAPRDMDKELGGLAPYREAFMQAAKKYGVDPILLLSIALHETGKGTSSAFRRKRNAMGVSDANGPRTFASVEESIFYMARQLKTNYIDRGLTSIPDIGRKYAPVGAGNDPQNLNRFWADGVSNYYNKLKIASR